MKIRFKHWTSNLRSITRGGNIYIYIYMTIWNKTIRNEVTVYEWLKRSEINTFQNNGARKRTDTNTIHNTAMEVHVNAQNPKKNVSQDNYTMWMSLTTK